MWVDHQRPLLHLQYMQRCSYSETVACHWQNGWRMVGGERNRSTLADKHMNPTWPKGMEKEMGSSHRQCSSKHGNSFSQTEEITKRILNINGSLGVLLHFHSLPLPNRISGRTAGGIWHQPSNLCLGLEKISDSLSWDKLYETLNPYSLRMLRFSVEPPYIFSIFSLLFIW